MFEALKLVDQLKARGCAWPMVRHLRLTEQLFRNSHIAKAAALGALLRNETNLIQEPQWPK